MITVFSRSFRKSGNAFEQLSEAETSKTSKREGSFAFFMGKQ